MVGRLDEGVAHTIRLPRTDDAIDPHDLTDGHGDQRRACMGVPTALPIDSHREPVDANGGLVLGLEEKVPFLDLVGLDVQRREDSGRNFRACEP